ncbi:MAG: hypothetical protein GXP24_14490 [Planctomycetes bacterium]|nr:hypothetical protein [Planctomycetota bacterium]
MPQRFVIQLEQVCRRHRRRQWLTAICWTLVAVLVAALVLMGLDRMLGIADPLGRGLLAITLLVLCGLCVRRWFVTVSENRVTPLQIAHEVEHRHPALRDVVANAWEFSRQADDDPTAGSVSLRRAIVLRAATAADEVEWRQLVPRQPLRQAAFALSCVGLTIVALSWSFPQALQIGLTRLTNPFSSAEWPREHNLQFVGPPTLLAAGEDLVLQLRDTRGPLPSSITMHYRTRRQGRWHEETQRLETRTNLSDDPFVIRRLDVQQSLQYRVTGADHQTMAWQSLKVVAAPLVEQLQITVYPPAYTQLPARLWNKNTSVFAGSNLELQGQTDQPVTNVVLLSSQGKKTAAQIGSGGQSFKIERSDWQIESSDTYTLQLTTAAGLTTRATTVIVFDVVADRPPEVRFIEPTNDLAVLPSVTVPLEIEAVDELAVREIELIFRRSDRTEESEQRLLLWSAPDAPASLPKEESRIRQQRVDFLWQLSALSLEPGCVVDYYARASDYKPETEQPATGQPATGQTVRVLRLKIVSRDELWRQIFEQQAHLVDSLAQLLREQRELRGMTSNWAEFPEWSWTRWANSSHAALFRQRQIADVLVKDQRSLLGQLADLTRTIERNRLMRPEAADRLRAAQELLQNLADDPLAAVEQSLSELTRQIQREPKRKILEPLITSTGDFQEQVVVGLRRVIDLLASGNVLGRFVREMAMIETDQHALAERCRVEIAPQLFSSQGEKSGQSTALDSAVRRQRELARRLAELIFDITQASQRMVEEEPALASLFAETVALAEKLGTLATIQTAADQLALRRLGRSVTMQNQTLEDLAKLRSRLAGQDVEGAADRLKSLQATERELQRLRRQVAALERELRSLSPEQRKKLAKETDAITDQLEQLRVPRAAKATRNAASRLRRATSESKVTQQARQQLDTAQRHLTTARRRQQVALARLQMAQLDAKLDSLIARQQTIQQGLYHLEHNKAQAQNISQLAGQQVTLREEVLAQADQLTSLPVFAHFLKMVGETMQGVEDRLQKNVFGQPTQVLAGQAVSQLTQLAKALRQERKKLANSSRNQNSSGTGQQPAGDTPQEQTLQLALGQLQLLKSLQTTLFDKTRTLESQLAASQSPTYVASELARQQQQLTELARQLVPEPADPPTKKLFPNLRQKLERPLDEITLPNSFEENQP